MSDTSYRDDTQQDYTRNFPDPMEIKPPGSDDPTNDLVYRPRPGAPPITAQPIPNARPLPPGVDPRSLLQPLPFQDRPTGHPLYDMAASAMPAGMKQFFDLIGGVESSNNPNEGYQSTGSIGGQYQQSLGFQRQYGGNTGNRSILDPNYQRRTLLNYARRALEANPRLTVGQFYSGYHQGTARPGQTFPVPRGEWGLLNWARRLGVNPNMPLASLLGDAAPSVPQRYFGNPYQRQVSDYGEPDFILKAAQANPGPGAPGYMPQPDEIANVLHSSMMGLSQFGSPQTAAGSIGVLRFYANMLLAQQRRQDELGKIHHQQYEEQFQENLDAHREELKKYSSCYAATQDTAKQGAGDIEKFKQCLLDEGLNPDSDKALRAALGNANPFAAVGNLLKNWDRFYLDGAKVKASSDKEKGKEEVTTAETAPDDDSGADADTQPKTPTTQTAPSPAVATPSQQPQPLGPGVVNPAPSASGATAASAPATAAGQPAAPSAGTQPAAGQATAAPAAGAVADPADPSMDPSAQAASVPSSAGAVVPGALPRLPTAPALNIFGGARGNAAANTNASNRLGNEALNWLHNGQDLYKNDDPLAAQRNDAVHRQASHIETYINKILDNPRLSNQQILAAIQQVDPELGRHAATVMAGGQQVSGRGTSRYFQLLDGVLGRLGYKAQVFNLHQKIANDYAPSGYYGKLIGQSGNFATEVKNVVMAARALPDDGTNLTRGFQDWLAGKSGKDNRFSNFYAAWRDFISVKVRLERRGEGSEKDIQDQIANTRPSSSKQQIFGALKLQSSDAWQTYQDAKTYWNSQGMSDVAGQMPGTNPDAERVLGALDDIDPYTGRWSGTGGDPFTNTAASRYGWNAEQWGAFRWLNQNPNAPQEQITRIKKILGL